MKKFGSFLWAAVLVFNVVGPAIAVPVTAWVTNERPPFFCDDNCQATYRLIATNDRVGVGLTRPLHLECFPSPSGVTCATAGPFQEPAVMFFFGAGLVALSGFRKKIKKKKYCVLANSRGLARVVLYK